MKVTFPRLHTFPALAPADLGGPTRFVDLPRNYIYLGLLIRSIVSVTAAVSACVRTEDGEFRVADRYQVRRDKGTPVDVTGRNLGHLVNYLRGVIGDVQETAPLVIGINVLDYTQLLPFCDPAAAKGSAAYMETAVVGPRRTTLALGVRPPGALDEIYVPGPAPGSTVVLNFLLQEVYGICLDGPTPEEITNLNLLRKELRLQSQGEDFVAAAAYGVYRNDHMDRDVRPLRVGIMTTDADLRVADTLDEASLKVAGVFETPENCPANLLKSLNVGDQRVDLPDGFDVAELDHARDHVSAPYAPDGAAFQLWRTLLAPVGAGRLETIQMSVGEAEYPRSIS